jgi:hypothetical protein
LWVLAIAAPIITLSLFAKASLAFAQDNVLAAPLAQTGSADMLHIALAPTLAMRPGSQAPLHIRIISPDDPPKNSIVRVRGLPPTISLSEGYATAPGAWDVPLNGVQNLRMNVPAGISGRVEVTVSLVNDEGMLLAEAKSMLTIDPPSVAATTPQERPLSSQIPAQKTEPVISPADREAGERFLSRGEHELESGNIAGARQFLQRAAQIGLARGALLLAGTYDPSELARWHVQGVQPNLTEARKWYERALELGAPEAKEHLARLPGSTP